jgi:hypothetical protein
MTSREAALKILEILELSTVRVDLGDPSIPENHVDQSAEFNLMFGVEMFEFSVRKTDDED